MPPGFLVTFLLSGIFLAQVADLTTIPVRKCCQKDEVLSVVESKPRCIKPKDAQPPADIAIEVRALNKANPGTDQTATLVISSYGEFPHCPKSNKMENHGIRTNDSISSMITLDAQLYISKYEPGNYQKDFCLDRHSETNKLIALMCDACREHSIVCYQMYCPHGQAYVSNPEYDGSETDNEKKVPANICSETAEEEYKPQFWDEEAEKPAANFMRDQNYYFVAPTTGKYNIIHDRCSSVVLASRYKDLANFTLLTDGRLKANYTHEYAEVNGTKTLQPKSAPKTEYWEANEFVILNFQSTWTYVALRHSDLSDEEEACNYSAKICLSISIFFLSLTLILHIMDNDLM